MEEKDRSSGFFVRLTLLALSILLLIIISFSASAEIVTVKGIDISHHQGSIDWLKVYQAGYRFAFIKASQGISFKDPKLEENIEASSNAGLLVGVYHFAGEYDPSTKQSYLQNPEDEAEHFLSIAEKYLQEGYLRPVLDLETRVAANGKVLNKEELSTWVDRWMETVKRETGVEPILYVNSFYAKNYLNEPIKKYNLWIAQWTYDQNTPPDIGIWDSWDFWQYSNKGTVPGIKGNVDLDIFNGDIIKLQTFTIKRKISKLYQELEKQVDIYNQNVDKIPSLIKAIFGNERIEGYVSNGEEELIGIITKNAKVIEFKEGGIENPTLKVYTDKETVFKIIKQENPNLAIQVALKALKDGKIRYEAVGIVPQIKTTVLTILIKIFDWLKKLGIFS